MRKRDRERENRGPDDIRKKLKSEKGACPEVQTTFGKKFEVRVPVFFSGFLGRMVRGAGGERVRMVRGEGGQYIKPVLWSESKTRARKVKANLLIHLFYR